MKAFTVSLLFAICSLASMVQVSFGVKGGINFSNVDGSVSTITTFNRVFQLSMGLSGKK